MNNPNPLVPQGALSQHSKKQANVKIAVVTILLAHVVVLGGLLIQGCKPDKTNKTAGTTNDSLPPLSTNDASVVTTTSNANPYASTSTNPASGLVGTSNGPVVSTGGISNPPTEFPSSTPLTTNGPAIATIPSGATKEYVIVKGDTLAGIATKNGVSLKSLLAANPNVVPSKLKVGTRIQIPEKSETTSPKHAVGTAGAGESAIPAASSTGTSTYVVKSGDTLTKIATAHGVKVKELQTLNHLTTTVVRANQKLKLPAKATNSHGDSIPMATDTIRSPGTNAGAGALTNR